MFQLQFPFHFKGSIFSLPLYPSENNTTNNDGIKREIGNDANIMFLPTENIIAVNLQKFAELETDKLSITNANFSIPIAIQHRTSILSQEKTF